MATGYFPRTRTRSDSTRTNFLTRALAGLTAPNQSGNAFSGFQAGLGGAVGQGQAAQRAQDEAERERLARDLHEREFGLQERRVGAMEADSGLDERFRRDTLAETIRHNQEAEKPKPDTSLSELELFRLHPDEYRKFKEAGRVAEEGASLDDEALNIAADMYVNSGQLPYLRGKGAAQWGVRILDRAAQRHPGANVALNKAGLQAGTKSLGTLQQTSNSAEAWANTVDKNTNVMLESLVSLPETGTRFGNKVARWAAGQLGDPNVAKFNAARETIKVEFARLLQSPGVANTMLSDAARHEVEHILAGDYTKAQMISALTALRRDSQNRIEAYRAQVGSIRSGIGRNIGSTSGEGDVIWTKDASGRWVRSQ